MKKRIFLPCLTAAFFMSCSPSLLAQLDLRLSVTGFGSVGDAMTNAVDVDFFDPIYKQKISSVPEIDGIGQNPVLNSDTLGGMQFAVDFNNTFLFGIQFLSQGTKNYAIETDLLYLRWNIDPNWDITVGRMRLPFYLYSEFYEVRYDYLWSRAPYEVYRFDPMTDFEGIKFRFRNDLPFGWYTEDMVAFGNTRFTYEHGPYLLPVAVDRGVVTNVTLGNDLVKLNAGYSAGAAAIASGTILTSIQNGLMNPCGLFNPLIPAAMLATSGPAAGTCFIDINSPFPVPIDLTLVIPDPITARLFTVKNSNWQMLTFGYEFEWNHILSIAEWTRHVGEDLLLADSQAWYVTLGFSWENLTPYVTYSDYRTLHDSDRLLANTLSNTFVNPFSFFGPPPIPTPETFQTSVNEFLALGNVAQSTINAGIRYDIAFHTALKFDYRYVIPREGTAGLFNYDPGKRISWVTAAINVIF